MGGAADMARLHQERKAHRLTRRAKRLLGTGTRGHTTLIAREPEPSEDRDAAVDSDKDRLDAAHLQQLAELVPGLGLTESWPSGSKSMDGDHGDRSPASTRKIPVSVLRRKVDTIEDMMKQAQTSLSFKQNEENEGNRNVSHESTDKFTPIFSDGKPGIPYTRGGGPPRPETVAHSKARKNSNSVTSSLGGVDPGDDKQDNDCAAPVIIDLSMFDDLDQLLNQLLADTNARTEVYGAAQEEGGVIEDSDEEESPSNMVAEVEAIEKHDVFEESDASSTAVLREIEEKHEVFKESDASSTAVLSDIEESGENKTLSTMETNSSVTEEPDAVEQKNKEESPVEIATLKDNKEDPTLATDTGEETAEEDPVNENEKSKEATEDPDIATDMGDEVGYETMEEESVDENETSSAAAEDSDTMIDTDEETDDERAEEESVNENETSKEATEDPDIATDMGDEVGYEKTEEESVDENETSSAAAEDSDTTIDTNEETDDERAEEEPVTEFQTIKEATEDPDIAIDMGDEVGYETTEEESADEHETSSAAAEDSDTTIDTDEETGDERAEEEPVNETSKEATEDLDIATDMGEEVSYETTEEESVDENATSSDAADDLDTMIDTDEETGDETVEEESVTEFQTIKDAIEDPNNFSNVDDETTDETAAEESVNEDEAEDLDGSEESVTEDETEDLDGAEQTDEETDEEESSVEGASTTEMVLEKPKVVIEVDEEEKPSIIEMKKTEAEDPRKNLEKTTSNFEAKKPEADDPWKNLDEVLQTDEEETYAECDEQDYDSDDNDSDDDPESDFSVMAIDFVVDFAGIVETLSEEFSDLMPGKRNPKSKSKFKFRDFVNDTEENVGSQRLTDKMAVLAKESPESKVYVHWDKSDVGMGPVTAGNTDHTLHVESDLSSLTAAATTSTDPAVTSKRLTTSFHFANKSLLSEDNEEEVFKQGAAPQAQKWLCCI
jgi:hypothetical protein